MPTTKTFRSGNSQAVRLPKEIAYDDDVELEIVRSGEVITMYPKPKLTMAEFIEALNALPKPETPWVREPIDFPNRWGDKDAED